MCLLKSVLKEKVELFRYLVFATLRWIKFEGVRLERHICSEHSDICDAPLK